MGETNTRVDDTIDPRLYDEVFGFGERVDSFTVRMVYRFARIIDRPTIWFRKYFVERFRGAPYPYYHQRFRRVPSIDQCYTDDLACIYEANQQYLRDRKVDTKIVTILRQRFSQCIFYNRGVNEFHDFAIMCPREREDMRMAELNYFIKYGDVGSFSNVIDVFMKQKHRLIVERRKALKENANLKENGECNE